MADQTPPRGQDLSSLRSTSMPSEALVEPITPSNEATEAQLLDLFFDRMPMGVAVFGTDMRLQRCNKTWVAFYEHYLGVPPEYTAPGRHINDLIPGNEEAVQELFDHALAGEMIRQAARRIDIPGKETYWDVVFAPLFDEGQVVGVVDVITDATDRVFSFQLLEARIATFSQLAAGMSIDQPLATTLAEVVAAVRGTTSARASSVISWEEDPTQAATAYADPILGAGFAAALEEIWVNRGFERLEPVPAYEVTIRRNFVEEALADPILAPVHPFLSDPGWRDISIIPLVVSGVQLGELVVYLAADQDLTTDDRAYLRALADQAAVAVRNSTMFHAAEQNAALVERHRLARELHDSVSQALFSMTLHARAAERRLEPLGPDADNARAEVARLRDLTAGALAEMRALIFELRPGALAEEGLAAALTKQAAAMAAREQIPITVTAPPARLRLSPDTEEHLYRIALEAMHNALKHARPAGIEVELTAVGEDSVRLTVTDDGTGFDPGLARPGHLGMGTMRERAQALGGQVTVESAPGRGTVVTVDAPTPR